MSFSNEKADEAQARVSHDDPALGKGKPVLQGQTETREVAAASIALEAAVAEAQPKLFSKHMLKLWGIMGIGYLISTMNGFGNSPKLYN